jgi:putative methionine-R-sulfoxide reductase with GAF domain
MNDDVTDLPPSPGPEDWTAFLQRVLAHFDCVTGTLHRLDPADGMLKMVAAIGVPEGLMAVVQVIPVGKGIAGVAAQRLEPVEMCNLQTDSSGVARPEAKQTGVQGTLAVPVMQGSSLRGTLGLGKMVPYDFSDEEKQAALAIGRAVAEKL